MKQLKLNKITIQSLNSDEASQIVGGAWTQCRATYGCNDPGGSTGCTDGCGIFFQTWYHCTDGHCTTNCAGDHGPLPEKRVTSA